VTNEDDSPAELLGQARKLQAILESAIDAIITIDRHGIITTVNPAAATLFGYKAEDFLGRNVHFLMPEPYHGEHDGYIENYRTTGRRKIIGIGREVTGRRSDGTLFPMHLAVSEFEMDGQTHFTGIIHDLSANKATESALRQAQKMEAMGQLTGGIAHDFNNLLTVIIGNLEMLEAKLTTPLQQELVTEALEAADLGARLTARLLAFARRSYLEPEIVNLNSFVVGLTDMLHRTLGATVYLSNALSPNLWSARVDPSQVESAIINLAVNARDAMPAGGKLLITARRANAVDKHLPKRDYVQLCVIDTGVGMTEDVRVRAVEPFFTTKPVGRGTGLGLATVYGIVKQNDGCIEVDSELGQGTTVRIFLPSVEAEVTGPTTDMAAALPQSGHETVLLVEDESAVLRLSKIVLERFGYTVLTAGTPSEAIHLFQTHEGRVHLLVTDVVMPEMNGRELAARLRESRPELKALFVSGYSASALAPRGVLDEGVHFLQKPFSLEDLASSVREALDAH
jgi:PAS domain S-box-containing protein